MTNDILDFSSSQHDQIRRLCNEVDAASPADKKRLFNDLTVLVNVHETSDREVVYPMVVDHTTGTDADARECMVEAGNILREVSSMQKIESGDDTFDTRFANLHHAILDHMAHEEHTEFPRIRLYVPVQRLHAAADEALDIQIMR